MINVVGALITSLAVSVFIFPILIKYSRKKKIWDELSHRRIHTRLTPSIGGVAIFFGFFTAVILWLDFLQWPELKIIIGILFITFLLGLCDDLVHIKPSVKLLGQTIAGSLVFFLLHVQVTSFYGIFSEMELHPLISYGATIFVIIIITNSFNLIDGIDGLAGVFSATSFLFFGIWFYLVGDINYALLCLSLLGAIIGFLIFNWEPSKIFMGDTGALLIGMMLSIVAMKFVNMNYLMPVESTYKFSSTIFTAFCVLIIPMLDTSRIIVIRLSKGISPLKPDKRHIHHSLVRIGLNHQRAVLVLTLVHLSFIAAAILLRSISDLTTGILLLVVVGIFNLSLNYAVKTKID